MPDTKEWTVMFYLASDNPLAISIVSQLKAIKAAGFHHEANVIAQFDPFTEGTPTHIFDVNLINKLTQPGGPDIGFADSDPYVRNMIEDRLWGEETDRDDEPIRDELKAMLKRRFGDEFDYNPPIAPELNGVAPTTDPRPRHREPDPYNSLKTFLTFCREHYPARHYILFILGHGVVLGNDIFLFDEHAQEPTITLEQLGRVLRDFKGHIEQRKGVLELVSFHSCSVSSLEVAYELKGTANYMLASQGPTFVGSWPYRQMLIRLYKNLRDYGTNIDIKKMFLTMFDYCLYNSADYLLAGYSYQLTLCDLRQVRRLKGTIEKLCEALIDGLSPFDNEKPERNPCVYAIVYAHWRSQSYFQEMYTDLYDFCLCFKKFTENAGLESNEHIAAINKACDGVMKLLETPDKDQEFLPPPPSTGEPERVDPIIVAAKYAGPAYQYSRGLSVYFPWSRPSEDSQIMYQYARYRISQGFSKSWFNFLEEYFAKTLRLPRNEDNNARNFLKDLTRGEMELRQDIGSLIYNGEGALGGFALAKTDPKDRTGGDCDCPTIKNFPRDLRSRTERKKHADKRSTFSVSPDLLVME